MKAVIDLHMHSTVSDGTDTPAEILENVKAAGISLFSVTDHDAIKSGSMIQEMLTEEDPGFITGVEFSCRDDEGKYHILGYGYDPEAESIRAVVDTGHGYRMKKVRDRVDFLISEFHFTFTEEELAELFAQDNPGKPHIGKLMVKHGYAGSIKEAIQDYIDKVHFKSEYVGPREAIEGILGAGGIPVLAHPSYGSGDQLILGEEMEQRLRKLMDYGLRGVEAFYSGFTAKLRQENLSLAKKYGLYVTAGSDYHGSNKLVQLADTGLSDVDEWPDGLYRFLQDAGRGEIR